MMLFLMKFQTKILNDNLYSHIYQRLNLCAFCVDFHARTKENKKGKYKMQSFEEFARQFDINDPAEYTWLLNEYQHYIDTLREAYGRTWTWCGGCHKIVRYDEVIVKDEQCGDRIKNITRCAKCGIPWHIKEVK